MVLSQRFQLHLTVNAIEDGKDDYTGVVRTNLLLKYGNRTDKQVKGVCYDFSADNTGAVCIDHQSSYFYGPINVLIENFRLLSQNEGRLFQTLREFEDYPLNLTSAHPQIEMIPHYKIPLTTFRGFLDGAHRALLSELPSLVERDMPEMIPKLTREKVDFEDVLLRARFTSFLDNFPHSFKAKVRSKDHFYHKSAYRVKANKRKY